MRQLKHKHFKATCLRPRCWSQKENPSFLNAALAFKSIDYTSFAHHHVGIHFKNKDGSINACIHKYTHKETNKKTGKIWNRKFIDVFN